MQALNGSGSPYVDRMNKVAPKVLAEWWIFAMRFQAMHAFVPKLADKVELIEWHSPMARYKLITGKSLGELFGQVEESKMILKVLEYSISATTLEQIFNSFARHQETQDVGPDGPKVVGEDMSVYMQPAYKRSCL